MWFPPPGWISQEKGGEGGGRRGESEEGQGESEGEGRLV